MERNPLTKRWLEFVSDLRETGFVFAEGAARRDKTKVVTFRVPHNAAVQIYDYKEKKAR